MRVEAKKESAIAAGQRSAASTGAVTHLDRLDELESQSVFIFREAFARLKVDRPPLVPKPSAD